KPVSCTWTHRRAAARDTSWSSATRSKFFMILRKSTRKTTSGVNSAKRGDDAKAQSDCGCVFAAGVMELFFPQRRTGDSSSCEWDADQGCRRYVSFRAVQAMVHGVSRSASRHAD